VSQYEVHVYFDGPYIHDDALVTVEAADPQEAVREAIAAIGLPRIAEVRLL